MEVVELDHLVLEIGLAIALIAAAGLLSAKLRLSVIPFYILIGMAVGPHAMELGHFDFRFIESAELIEFLGRIGVFVSALLFGPRVFRHPAHQVRQIHRAGRKHIYLD
ncbi:hypothetical protein HMSSN139_35680 [Paenibacillus sp. HMSSN-139]|nr:hypothetical protein HMSSN139_35680 [Paenibacillus sp. HMSSN-139]